MSTGASKASKDAMKAAELDKAQRLQYESELKRDKMRTQSLFIRQLRGQQTGGFFSQGPGNTLG